MFGLIVSGLKYASTWAAVVHGSSVVSGAAKKMLGENEDSRVLPVIAGIGDTFTTLLDPLDFSGTRKRKEDAQKAAQQSAQQKAAAAKKKAKNLEKALKVQKAKNQKAANALKKVNENVAKLKKEAAQLRAQGKAAAAKAKEDKARAAQRYANFANRAAIQSRQVKDDKPEAGAMFAAQALELAKLALSPPANAVEALGRESTDAGRSFIASLVDTVNRPEEPDVEAVFAQLSQGDPDAWAAAADWGGGEGDDYIDGPDDERTDGPDESMMLDHDRPTEFDEPTVAGAGCGGTCSACSAGNACGSLTAAPDFLAGPEDEGDESAAGPDFSAWLNGFSDGSDEVNGSDYYAYVNGSDESEGETLARRYTCVDGRCFADGGEFG